VHCFGIQKSKDVQEKIPTDAELIKEIIEGRPQQFELLIIRYNQRLFRVIRIYISEQEQIEDLMQDTYLKCFENLRQFSGKSSFATWLTRIAINNSLMYLRDRKKEQSIFYPITNFFQTNALLMGKSKSPEEKLINRETAKYLEKSINDLPCKYKEVFMLSQIEQMKSSEVAECLDISEENVRVRMHRAKSLLREKLLPILNHGFLFAFGNEHCKNLTMRVMQQIQEVI